MIGGDKLLSLNWRGEIVEDVPSLHGSDVRRPVFHYLSSGTEERALLLARHERTQFD